MNSNAIVVGTDGSAVSLTAVRWAAREAGRRGAPLRVLLAYEWAWPGAEFSPAPPVEAAIRQQAEAQVAAAVAQARSAAAGIDVTGTAVRGRPAHALLTAARNAALLVVGGRGHGGFVNLVLGSVSLEVATHGTAPVVVVRGHAGLDTGPVVVGVDSSPAADDALRAAFEAASVRNCPLVAVRAYDLPMIWDGYGLASLAYDPADIEAAERRSLTEAVEAWRQKYPEVPVETVVSRGSTAQVLVAASHTAQLVVIGTRGHGGFTGLLLGSTGQQLLHHTESPVLIARSAA